VFYIKWVKRSNALIKEDSLILEKLCVSRGIKPSKVGDWINPSSKYLLNPYDLSNIDIAVTKIIKAIHQNKRIVVVSDIDTDGVCSTAIMFNYLKELTENIRFIHAQRSDGHGLETVLHLLEDSDDLIVVVDSSTNSTEACKTIVEQGKEIIIIDHHISDRPNEYATIVNCQIGEYANKNLSGSAMCLKVCQVLDEYLGIEQSDMYWDLATIGMIADMMDMSVMENRYIANMGLNEIHNKGIKMILTMSNTDFTNGITSTDISFLIAPMLGASSRFDKIELALQALTTENDDVLKEIIKSLIVLNDDRKTLQKKIIDEIIDNQESHEDNIVIIVDNSIDSGFRGLIATGLVEEYNKPCFVFSEYINDDGITEYRGSARGIGSIKLKSLCTKSGLVDLAQGHEPAFGIWIKKEKIQDFINYFNECLIKDDMQKVFEYDAEVYIDEITDIDIKQVEKFSRISGHNFPEPKFRIKNIVIEEGHTSKLGEHVRAVLGKNKETIKLYAENNFVLLKFRSSEDYAKDIEEHFHNNLVTEIEVIGTLSINKFYNWGLKKYVVTNQIFIDDYKIN